MGCKPAGLSARHLVPRAGTLSCRRALLAVLSGLLFGFLGVAACGRIGPPVSVAARTGPALDGDAINALLELADDARRQAYAAGDPTGLSRVLIGSALSEDMQRLGRGPSGPRLEERLASRRLVHVGSYGNRPEGVLEIHAQSRIAIAGQLDAPWSNVVRQWWARLEPVGGSWLVAEDRDLAPPDWWH